MCVLSFLNVVNFLFIAVHCMRWYFFYQKKGVSILVCIFFYWIMSISFSEGPSFAGIFLLYMIFLCNWCYHWVIYIDMMFMIKKTQCYLWVGKCFGSPACDNWSMALVHPCFLLKLLLILHLLFLVCLLQPIRVQFESLFEFGFILSEIDKVFHSSFLSRMYQIYSFFHPGFWSAPIKVVCFVQHAFLSKKKTCFCRTGTIFGNFHFSSSIPLESRLKGSGLHPTLCFLPPGPHPWKRNKRSHWRLKTCKY